VTPGSSPRNSPRQRRAERLLTLLTRALTIVLLPLSPLIGRLVRRHFDRHVVISPRMRQAREHLAAAKAAQDPAVRVEQGRLALAALQAELELPATHGHQPDPTRAERERETHLPDLAEAALAAGEVDQAAGYAREMLAAAEAGAPAAGEWHVGNLIHDGHAILGRIALAAGELDRAQEHLLLAGASPGSPQLFSFGPDLTLANELLEQGRSEAVVAYLRLCHRFWRMRRRQLRRWIREIQAGGRPTLHLLSVETDINC
jgi:hypothetical protein